MSTTRAEMDKKRSLAVSSIIENLAHYQETANRTATLLELRSDPVPGMMKMLTAGRYFAFLDMLGSAAHVRSWIVSVSRFDIALLIDFSRIRVLDGDEAARDYLYEDHQPPQFIVETGAGSLQAAEQIQRMEEARLRQKCRDMSPSRWDPERLPDEQEGQQQHMPTTAVGMIRSRSLTCHLCGSVLQSNSALMDHWQHKHPEFKPICCQVCKKGFRNESELSRHAEGHALYQCTLCPWNFPKRASLVRHMTGHLNDEGRACQYCSFRSKSKRSISVHEGKHPEEVERRSLAGQSTAEIHAQKVRRREQNRRAAAKRLKTDEKDRPSRVKTAGKAALDEVLKAMSLDTAREILKAWSSDSMAIGELDSEQSFALLRRLHGERAMNGRDVTLFNQLGKVAEITKQIRYEEAEAALQADIAAIAAQPLSSSLSYSYSNE
jgi:hypothetical protein